MKRLSFITLRPLLSALVIIYLQCNFQGKCPHFHSTAPLFSCGITFLSKRQNKKSLWTQHKVIPKAKSVCYNHYLCYKQTTGLLHCEKVLSYCVQISLLHSCWSDFCSLLVCWSRTHLSPLQSLKFQLFCHKPLMWVSFLGVPSNRLTGGWVTPQWCRQTFNQKL